MWGGYNHMMSGCGGMFMWIIWIIVIFAIVYGLARNSKTGSTGTGSNEKPLDVLKKRYARGEITKQEFDTIKKDLES